jgi:hypothetical protein
LGGGGGTKLFCSQPDSTTSDSAPAATRSVVGIVFALDRKILERKALE